MAERDTHNHFCQGDLNPCADCWSEMEQTTRARSPLACLVFGFEDVFAFDWAMDFETRKPRARR